MKAHTGARSDVELLNSDSHSHHQYILAVNKCAFNRIVFMSAASCEDQGRMASAACVAM